MERNVFVKTDLLYKQIDGPLEELDSIISQCELWLNAAIRDDKGWIPSDIKNKLQWAKEENKKASKMIEDIHTKFAQFKRRHSGKSKATEADVDGKEIEHLMVITGDLYKPPQVKVVQEDDLLSDSFKAWRKSQRPEVQQ